MTSAPQFSARLRRFPRRLLGALVCVTQRRQRRRLLIWDPQVLPPSASCVLQEKAVARQ